MKSVNKVILLGNVGQAPEVKDNPGGTLRAAVSIATNERKKVGEKYEDHTEWHSVIFFGRLAVIARDYLRKGSKVYISGRLRTISWEDDTQQKRWKTNIVAEELVLLDGKDSSPAKVPDEAYSGAI